MSTRVNDAIEVLNATAADRAKAGRPVASATLKAAVTILQAERNLPKSGQGA